MHVRAPGPTPYRAFCSAANEDSPRWGDRHTLGPAGRSGGVDQVGDVIDGQSSRTIGVGDRFRRGGAVSGDQRQVVQAQPRDGRGRRRQLGETIITRVTGDPEFGAAVLQQIGDSIVGQCGIDRYECGTCGEHGQRRGHRIHARGRSTAT